jgi:hypothetical protein
MSRSQPKTTTENAILDAIELLTEELKVLRIVVDELREEVQWNNQHPQLESDNFAGRRIVSCSLDPTRRDFQVNSVPTETVESLRAEVATSTSRVGKQGELFR